MIVPQDHIAGMAAYALADLSPPKGKRLISLSQNESLRPPAPGVLEAISKAASGVQAYPDPDWTDLRKALATQHGIDPALILCGNGSLDLIGCLARVYLGPSDAALAPAHAYPFFKTATLMTGARFDTAPETGLTADVDALLAAVTSETRIVFLANPGNPTGTRLSRADVLRLRDGLQGEILLVLDEAYGEFADHLSEPMFDLVTRGNTVLLRTFSKAYGLAGMRVGWGYFPPEIRDELRKVINPNNVSGISQVAALAALVDQNYMRETCRLTAHHRDAFIPGMRDVGIDASDSFANFALLSFATSEQAASVGAALRREGVFVRPQSGAGLPHCLRVTIAQEAEMTKAAQLIKKAVCHAN
ncbi:MAG: histidinol-phosphate transaminase [Pseudomonadota bacterium]